MVSWGRQRGKLRWMDTGGAVLSGFSKPKKRPHSGWVCGRDHSQPTLSHTHSVPQHGELLMLAAGTGLAPMVPILHSITDNADDETFVTLVSCFKTFEGIYLKTFLEEQARFWNIRTFFVLSQVSPGRGLPSLVETLRSPAPVLSTCCGLCAPCCDNSPAAGGIPATCLAGQAGTVMFLMQVRRHAQDGDGASQGPCC